MKRRLRETLAVSKLQPFLERVRENKTIILVVTVCFLFLLGSYYLYVITQDLPSLSRLEEYQPKLASKVYSADMQLIHEYYIEKRSFVPLEQMPKSLIEAVIATEDRKFFDHWGMDVRRFAGAILNNILSLDLTREGASTLTQQLARQLYLSTTMGSAALDKTLTRKIRELITAIQIERTYTKPEILEMYLNHMYFGHSAYGAQSAARTYFGKDVGELTRDESAVLVGLLKAPNNYTPLRYPNRCLARRNIVLGAMRDVKYIGDEEYADLMQKPIQVEKTGKEAYGLAPYFTEYIRQTMQDRYGYDLYTDGLSIYTTLDSRAQYLAEKYVDEFMPKLQKKVNNYYERKKLVRNFVSREVRESDDFEKLLRDSAFVDSVIEAKARAEVALVSIDPRNGHILAFIGGRNFSNSKYIRAVQARRQPGSSFKPFVYTVAIDNGYPPTYEVLNQPVVNFMHNDERWTPKNFDGKTGGPTTFREGLRRSLNLVTVRVLQSIIERPERVVEYARKMGIKSPLQAVDAIALGASEVTPLEITSAYGVFANGGILNEPMAITRVEDRNGNVIEQFYPNSEEVLSKETSYIMTDMLGTVINQGTGAGARSIYGFRRPAGGKTGTTNDCSDAWFMGFTPQIVTGVWVGIDDYSIGNIKLTLGPAQTGATAALPIWAPYMRAVHDSLNLPVQGFEKPDGVVRVDICADSKLLARGDCPCQVVSELFFKELAPTETCDSNRTFTRNKNQRPNPPERGRRRF